MRWNGIWMHTGAKWHTHVPALMKPTPTPHQLQTPETAPASWSGLPNSASIRRSQVPAQVFVVKSNVMSNCQRRSPIFFTVSNNCQPPALQPPRPSSHLGKVVLCIRQEVLTAAISGFTKCFSVFNEKRSLQINPKPVKTIENSGWWHPHASLGQRPTYCPCNLRQPNNHQLSLLFSFRPTLGNYTHTCIHTHVYMYIIHIVSWIFGAKEICSTAVGPDTGSRQAELPLDHPVPVGRGWEGTTSDLKCQFMTFVGNSCHLCHLVFEGV